LQPRISVTLRSRHAYSNWSGVSVGSGDGRGAKREAEGIPLSETGADNPAAEGPGPKTEEFLRLLGAHERSLFAYVYALAPGWQDAEEVMQRLRIRIWQQFDQYEPDKPFEAWARAIAYYLVLAYRKEKSRQREFFAERVLEAVSGQYEKHLESSNGRRDALVDCLDKLDGRKRELVNEYYSSTKLSAEAISEKLSMSPNAVRQSLFRIRKVLLDCVERELRVESRGGQQ
jgi:RNA polymerase sigma-70 factor, ECF subfamily